MVIYDDYIGDQMPKQIKILPIFLLSFMGLNSASGKLFKHSANYNTAPWSYHAIVAGGDFENQHSHSTFASMLGDSKIQYYSLSDFFENYGTGLHIAHIEKNRFTSATDGYWKIAPVLRFTVPKDGNLNLSGQFSKVKGSCVKSTLKGESQKLAIAHNKQVLFKDDLTFQKSNSKAFKIKIRVKAGDTVDLSAFSLCQVTVDPIVKLTPIRSKILVAGF